MLRELGLARGAGAHFAANHASPLVELGRWDEAYEVLDEALGRDEPAWWRGVPLQAHAWLSWVTGDLEAADRDLDEVARLSPELVEGQFIAPQAQASAVMAIASQQWEAAVQTVAAAVSRLPVEGRRARRALGDDDGAVARVLGRRGARARAGRARLRLARAPPRRDGSALDRGSRVATRDD